MTTEIAEKVVLCKEDLKAMRLADSVSFHYNGEAEGSKIHCSKRVRDVGPYDDREKHWDVIVQSTFGTVSMCSDHGKKPSSCFEMMFGTQFHQEWQTVVSCLKVGDELTLHWVADGQSTGYSKRCRITETNDNGESYSPGMGMAIHADCLYLKVKRGEKRLSFLLDVSLCPDNSARMIRGYS